MKHTETEISAQLACATYTASSSLSANSSQRTISVVSMFSGCGGLDLGLMGGFTYRDRIVPRSSFRILRAYDNDAACGVTYKANIGPHFELADLATRSVDDMPTAEVLIGGFPCQEFSICGPRGGTSATRGKLYRAMVRYARVHRPSIIVAENVAHLPRLNNGADFSRIRRAFASAGYRCELWRVSCPDYGIPQARERIVLFFHRSDLKLSIELPEVPDTGYEPTAEWAIADLENVHDESVPNQSQYFKAGLAKSGNGQGDERTKRKAPGYTVRANARSRVQFHYSLDRRLTVRELARLQTFPDSFVFPHAATPNVKQIGNAVPPLLGVVIANIVARALS